MRAPVFLRQAGGLLRKQLILSYRVLTPTLAHLLAPFAICLFVFLMQQLTNYMSKQDDPHPPSSVVGGIPRCTYEKKSCYALAYGPSDVAWVKELAMMAAAASGLNFNTDVYEFEGNVHDCDDVLAIDKRDCQIGLMNTLHQNMYAYFVDHPMGVENAVLFTSAFFEDVAPVNATMGMPVDSGYVLWYNQTDLNPTLLNTKRIIDQAILRKQSNSSNANIEVEWGIFPRAPFRNNYLDMASSLGGLWFYLPACTIFFFLLVEIVTEKDSRLRIGMKMMGLRTSAYWLSWFVYAMLICALHTLVLMASAAIFQLDVFTRTNQGVVFFSFFLFALSMAVFGFFLSTVIKTAQTAQTAGYTVVLIGFVFQSMVSSQGGMMLNMMFGSDVLPGWATFVKFVLCFFPPIQMARAYYGMNSLSGKVTNADGVTTQGAGFKWSDWGTRMKQTEDENVFGVEIDMPPVSEAIGWMFILLLVWGIAAWYCDHVVTGEHGPGQAPWFFLTPSYWGIHRKRRSRAVESSKIPEEFEMPERCHGDNDVRAERDAIDRGEGVYQQGDVEAGSPPPTGTFALVIHHLSKVYQGAFGRNKFPALVDMSLRVQSGEILGLLGHNGAGKTTLISVLTGITPPTEGMALVYGNDVVTNPTEVRAATGVCPQYDILWGMLTAEEHMRLFCTLKGVNNTEHEMQDKLTMTALWKIRKQRVHSFSGGMKRRLSVAMSAIGDPKIIYMDEPTTGLDPVNRRGVWELVLKMREGRAIILTTHSMQEADVLCDRIGMMAKGCLCCLGTSLHLKQKYGTGYHIHVMATAGHSQALAREITELCPTALLGDRDGEGMEVTIPYDSAKEVQHVLEMLERESGEEEHRRRVREWGLLQTSLESVFCRIMDQHEFKVDGAKEGEDVESEEAHPMSPANNESETTDEMVPPTTRPLRAMLFKSATLQKRQKCTNCCQICTPVLVLIIMLIMQLIINSQMKETTFRYLVGSSPISMSLDFDYNLVSPFQKKNPSKPAVREMHVQDDDEIKDQNATCLTFFLATYQQPLADLGFLASNGTMAQNTLLSQLAQHACALDGGNGFDATTVQQPYFDLVQGSFGTAEDIVLRTMKSFASYNWERLKQAPQVYQLPDAIVGFNTIDKSTAHLNYRFAINDGGYVLYHRANNFTRIGTTYTDPFCDGCSQLDLDLGRVKMMATLHTAFNELVTGVAKTKASHAISGGSAAADLPLFMNAQFLQAMPYYATKDLSNIVDIFGQFLYPIALSIQLPLYIYIIVMEKEDHILDLMRSMGLTTVSYYFANYIFFVLMYLVTVALFWIVGAIIKLGFFATHPGVLFLLFIGWGHALIALAFFFASITKTKRSASIIGYGVAFLGTLLGLVLCATIYGHNAQSIADEMPWGWNLIPMLAFCRSIYLATYQCSEPIGCFDGFKGPGASEIGQCIGFMFLDAFLYFVLSLYFNAVIASHPEAVTKHPLFFLQPLWKRIYKKSKVSNSANVVSTVDGALEPDAAADVLAEETRVMTGAYPTDTPLVVKQLRKVYDNGKVALRGISWACGKGECLGYLGENGCGKTTSMRMLTGSLAPTSGTALVGGYNIRTDIEKVRLVVGVCPQFSVVWPQLTCREHALFYARLKGVPPKHEKDAAEKALKEVGLFDFQHRHAGRLSGGMKRRLSIAIALVGGSNIIFLDEPTTGLDPVSRKGVWRVLLRAKEGRAVVLTTHAMEEAELLCNRIAILAHGRMRCIGTQQHLMNQLYSGYMLTVNYNPAATDEARAFIMSLFPQAEVHQLYQGSCVFRLPTSVRPSYVFHAMTNAVATNATISNWGYSQVGLEEVFTEVIEKAHREREAEENGVTQVVSANSSYTQASSQPRTPPEVPPAKFLVPLNPARDPPPSPALPESAIQQV